MRSINVDEAAREITSLSMDQVFEKAEQAIQMAYRLGAIGAVKEDIKDAYGADISDEVLHHALVCGFSLALVMAQRSAANYLEEQKGSKYA